MALKLVHAVREVARALDGIAEAVKWSRPNKDSCRYIDHAGVRVCAEPCAKDSVLCATHQAMVDEGGYLK